jgi:glycosyltransferase involved in cell wall biosynthesis
MKVRIYFPYAPFPTTEGAYLVVADQLRYFAKRGDEVEFVCWRETEEALKEKRNLSGIVGNVRWTLLKCRKETSWTRISRIVQSIPTTLSSVEAFHFPVNLLSQVRDLEPVDLAIYHFSFAYVWLARNRLLPNEERRVVHFHNIESELHALRRGGFGLIQWINVTKLRAHERRLSALIDEAWFLSPLDARKLKTNRMRLVPPTFDPTLRRKRKAGCASTTILGFIGAMDNRPNFESVKWLLEELSPALLAGGFSGKLLIAGRDPPQRLRKIGREFEFVEFAGFVKNIDEFWSCLSFLAAPHIVGSGVRTKILEAIASGVPVLTNPGGAAPLSGGVRASPFLICEDNAAGWAARILSERGPFGLRKALEDEPIPDDLIAESVYASVVR